MDEFFSGMLYTALFIFGAYLLGPDLPSIISNDRVNVYLLDVSKCDDASNPEKNCEPRRLMIAKMSIDFINSRVTSKPVFSSDAFQGLTAEEKSGLNSASAEIGVLENCKIFDRINWKCGDRKMIDGTFFAAQNIGTKQVPGWGYRLVGLGLPIPKTWIESTGN